MPLPCPGPAPISLLDIQNEFGGTYLDGTYTQIAEYYRGGAYVQNTSSNQNIPTSGQISFNNFFCTENEIVVYITTNTANVVVSTLFGSYWNSIVRKRLVINPGVTVYNTNPYDVSNFNGYAMRIYDTFQGRLTIQNYGSIQGAAGRRGGDTIISGESRTNQSNGGNGGNAIYIGPVSYGGAASNPRPVVYFDNQGTIYAGGGGGGQGGSTSSGTSSPVTYSYRPYGSCCPLDITVQGRGSSGGLGGWGQGYNQTNTTGSNGLSAGAVISATMTSLGCNGWQFPPDSSVQYDAYSSGQNGIHRFGSRTSLTYAMRSSGTPGGLSFRGDQNSIGIYDIYSSGFTGSVTKDPNQSIFGNMVPKIRTINNVPGGGPETTPGILVVSTNGVSATINIPSGGGTGGGGGDGATWGNYGSSGGGTGSGNGGTPGFSIINESMYVSYINRGTIAGPTT